MPLNHQELKARLLGNPDVRAEWDRTTFARAVANQLVQYRAEHNLTQRALATMLGVPQPTVARLELGEHEPQIATLRRLAQRLNLRFDITINPGNGPQAIDQGDVEVLVLTTPSATPMATPTQ